MNSWASASATTRTRTRSTYSEQHGDERTVNAPDVSLRRMDREGTQAKPTAAARDAPRRNCNRWSYTYLIRDQFAQGAGTCGAGTGRARGMAESVYLQDGTHERARPRRSFEGELKEFGVEVRVASFGAPGYSAGCTHAVVGQSLRIELGSDTLVLASSRASSST